MLPSKRKNNQSKKLLKKKLLKKKLLKKELLKKKLLLVRKTIETTKYNIFEFDKHYIYI
jgi:hypothetical protein